MRFIGFFLSMSVNLFWGSSALFSITSVIGPFNLLTLGFERQGHAHKRRVCDPTVAEEK